MRRATILLFAIACAAGLIAGPTLAVTYEPGPGIVAIAAGSADGAAWSHTVYTCVNTDVSFRDDNSYDLDIVNDPGAIYDTLETWTWDFGDGQSASGQTVTHKFQNPGTYTVTLTVDDKPEYADDSAAVSEATHSVTVYAVEISMTNPRGDPTNSGEAQDGVNEFTFDTSSPGVCHIHCQASVNPDTPAIRDWAKDHAAWSINPGISGSTMTWEKSDHTPGDNKGLDLYMKFAGLPSNNASFGNKTVKLTICGVDQSNPIRVFFPKDGVNHPGGGTPDWYYYWSQTSAHAGTHNYTWGGKSRTLFRMALG